MSSGTDNLASGLPFLGYLCSNQPWETEIILPLEQRFGLLAALYVKRLVFPKLGVPQLGYKYTACTVSTWVSLCHPHKPGEQEGPRQP